MANTIKEPSLDNVIPHFKSTTSYSSKGKIRFDWTIKDFLVAALNVEKEDLFSTTFLVNSNSGNSNHSNNSNNSANFHLSLHNNKDLGVYLTLVDQQEVTCECVLSVLRADGISKWPLSKSNIKKFAPSTNEWGFPMKIQTLREYQNDLLPNGQLTIVLDLTVFFGNAFTHTPIEGIIPSFPRGPGINESLISLLKDPNNLSDITLKCEDKSFPCHKNILIARSDVFKAMFDKQFIESKNKEVIIEDVEPEIMEMMIKAFYSDTFSEGIINDQSCLQLLKAADKYNFKYLKIACEEKIARSLNVGNAAAIFSWALACNFDNLKKAAKNYVEKHIVQIMGTSSFADLMKSFPDALKKNEEEVKGSESNIKSNIGTDNNDEAIFLRVFDEAFNLPEMLEMMARGDGGACSK